VTQIVGSYTQHCISWQRWIFVFIIMGAVALSIHSVCAIQTGNLRITSSSGAWVYIDGSYKGVTPLLICDLLPGSYEIQLRKIGGPATHYDYTSTITIYAGKEILVTAELGPVGPDTLLNVSSSPPGADVYIDSSYRGITPIKISNLTSKSHTVRVVKSGYIAYSTTTKLSEGRPIDVTANLNQITTVTIKPTGVIKYFTDTPILTTTLTLTPISAPSPSPSNTFNLLVVVGIILLFCIGGGGYYILHSRKP